MTNIFSKIIGIITIIIVSIFIGILLYIRMIPTKYLILFILVIGMIGLLVLYFIFRKKTKNGTRILISILCVIGSVCCIVGSIYAYKIYYLIDSSNNRKEEVDRYFVVVLKDSKYTKVEDLKDHKISIYQKEDTRIVEAIKELQTKISFIEDDYTDINKMTSDLLNHKKEAIIIKETHKSIMDEQIESFKDSVKIIYTVTLMSAVVDIAKKIDPLNEPFNLFISGIDVYGDIMTKSQGDVNMVVTVNPKTKEILLTIIPRDYYIKLHGIVGSKDKLTHAAYYGIEMSVKTVEDLLETNINYYVRVNFDTLIKVVDVIGGIDVYSDCSFRPLTNGKLYINKGMNHMNGAMALAFSRERMSYGTGDRHRGQNQQAVLTAIMNKGISSTTLLTSYSNILDTLHGSFETNIETSIMTSFIRNQVDKMSKWNIKSYNLNGFDSYNMTYSLGIERYVMEPDINTVNAAKEYIKGMTRGKTFAQMEV